MTPGFWRDLLQALWLLVPFTVLAGALWIVCWIDTKGAECQEAYLDLKCPFCGQTGRLDITFRETLAPLEPNEYRDWAQRAHGFFDHVAKLEAENASLRRIVATFDKLVREDGAGDES